MDGRKTPEGLATSFNPSRSVRALSTFDWKRRDTGAIAQASGCRLHEAMVEGSDQSKHRGWEIKRLARIRNRPPRAIPPERRQSGP